MAHDDPSSDLSAQPRRRLVTPTRVVLFAIVLVLAVRLVWRFLGR